MVTAVVILLLVPGLILLVATVVYLAFGRQKDDDHP
jgi:hypothetical protein